MRNKLYGWMMVISACTCFLQQSLADDEQIGLAASDPAQVAGIIAQMDAGDVPAFAGQVMQAIATMPVSPALRLQQMQDVAEEFLKFAPPEVLASLLSHLIMNVPFQMLPELNDAFRTCVAERTAAMDDAAYDIFTEGVLDQIEEADALTDEDRTIYATVAIVVLARGETPEAVDAFVERTMDSLPETYQAQVMAAVPQAMAGDYSTLLMLASETPDSSPSETPASSPSETPASSPVVPSSMGQAEVVTSESIGLVVEQPNDLAVDVNRPFPLPPSEPEPPVPPPYTGQF